MSISNKRTLHINAHVIFCHTRLYLSHVTSSALISFPDPTLKRDSVWAMGTLKCSLGRAHHHVISHAPTQTYANNHMIAELAEPRIGANVPRPFPS